MPAPRRRCVTLLVTTIAALLIAPLPTASAQASPQRFAAQDPYRTAVAAAPARTLGVNATRIGTTARIYAIDTAGAAYQQVLRGRTWTARAGLGGGAFRAAPAAVYRARGERTDLFGVSASGQILQKTGLADRWGGWYSLPLRSFAGALSAVITPSGVVHLFGPDSAGRVVHAFHDSSGWRQTTLTGDIVRGNVSAVYTASGDRIDLFSVDRHGRIEQRTSVRGRWGYWHPVSRGGFAGGVAAIPTGTDGWRVMARAGNGQSYQAIFSSRVWRSPAPWGGASVGHPAAIVSGAGGLFLTVGSGGIVSQRSVGSSCCRWQALPHPTVRRPTPAPAPPTTRVELAQALLKHWGGRLTGLDPVRDDLAVTAAGRAVRNPCGESVYLDPAMLRVVWAAISRYRVFVNNMVSGRGCDSGYHPRGKAVDFNTVVEIASGRSTNWHTGSSADNQPLDREFLTYTAAQVRTGGGAGQANCAGSATAPLPPGMIRFADSCNHQHLDTRP